MEITEAPTLVKMPEGMNELVSYLDDGSTPQVMEPHQAPMLSEPMHGDCGDDKHKLLFFGGVTLVLLLMFRMHN